MKKLNLRDVKLFGIYPYDLWNKKFRKSRSVKATFVGESGRTITRILVPRKDSEKGEAVRYRDGFYSFEREATLWDANLGMPWAIYQVNNPVPMPLRRLDVVEGSAEFTEEESGGLKTVRRTEGTESASGDAREMELESTREDEQGEPLVVQLRVEGLNLDFQEAFHVLGVKTARQLDKAFRAKIVEDVLYAAALDEARKKIDQIWLFSIIGLAVMVLGFVYLYQQLKDINAALDTARALAGHP